VRVPSNLKSGDLGFNMTPMIDVVFLLIIFFLVSSHLAKQEAQMDLDLPDVVEIDDPAVDAGSERVIVNVQADGQLYLAGHRVTPDEVQRRLRDRVAASGRDLEVRIRSDRRAPYGHVEPIMLACARSGIWNVTFAVIKEKP
jgi:biopolymer transport protein ExbD